MNKRRKIIIISVIISVIISILFFVIQKNFLFNGRKSIKKFGIKSEILGIGREVVEIEKNLPYSQNTNEKEIESTNENEKSIKFKEKRKPKLFNEDYVKEKPYIDKGDKSILDSMKKKKKKIYTKSELENMKKNKKFEIETKLETKKEKKYNLEKEKEIAIENKTETKRETLEVTKEKINETKSKEHPKKIKEKIWVVDIKAKDAVYENKCKVIKPSWIETTNELLDFDQEIKERWFVSTELGVEYYYSSKEAFERHHELGNLGYLGNWGTAEDEVKIINEKYKTIEHPEEKECKKVLVQEAIKEQGHWEYR